MVLNKIYNRIVSLAFFFMATVTMQAQDYTVNDLADTDTGTGTSGTLRWCINQANAAGAGPHAITFDTALSGGTITLGSSLPTVSVSNVTIDGVGDGNGNITIDANGGNIVRDVFLANGTGDFVTFKNFIIQDTGSIAFNFSGSPTDVTIENIVVLHNDGNYLNYGILYTGNAVNLSVSNFKMTQQENYNFFAIYITGTANNVLIDNFDLSDSGGGTIQAIRINGAANNVTIQNCDIDLDLAGSTDDGDYGIVFAGAASNITLKDNTFTNIDVTPIHFSNTATDINIDGFEFINNDGGNTAYGINFKGVATNVDMSNITIDQDHAAGADDGNYGIYFDTTATNISLDTSVMHATEIYGFYIGGVATNVSITNATFNNNDGWISNQMIRFQGVVNGLVMTNVTIDADLDGDTNDGDYGVYFISTATNITLTNVNINEADDDAVYFGGIVDDLTITGGSFNNGNDGIEFYTNQSRSNNVITGATFDGNTRAGILIATINATTEFNINNNIFSNTTGQGRGIWLYSTGGVKDIQITNNTFYNNLGAGIYNEQADGVLYSQNAFYNNSIGIDNVANNGNNDLELADGDTPVILSSVNTGVDTYDVTFTTPPVAVCSPCEIEFYTNLATDAINNGRTYIQTETALAGGTTYTRSINSGGNNTGFWTTTLKSNNLNNSVSEFGKKHAISPQGPGDVDNGIAVWLRADIGLTANGFSEVISWNDESGNVNHPTVVSTPDFETNTLNFNPGIQFNGVSTNEYFDFGNIAYGWTEGQAFIVTYQDNADVTARNETGIWRIGGNSNSHQAWTNEGLYESFGNSSLISNIGTPAGTHIPYMYSVKQRTDASGDNTQLYWNGASFHSSNRTTYFPDEPVWLGRNRYGDRYQGHIQEFILYDKVLSVFEQEKVETYLAIKYGMTLPHNYYASDWDGVTGTTLWALGGGYDNDITGIGRDDDTSLNQKQSKSINEGAIVAMGVGAIATTNTANANTFAADNSFLVWGNDAGSTSLQNTGLPSSAAAEYRLGRTWKVAETGSVSDLTIAFSNVPNGYNIELYIKNNDTDFTTGATVISGVIVNNKPTFTGVDLNDGDVFTLGLTQGAPGGVINNLSVWLKADLGVYSDSGVTEIVEGVNNVQEWHEQSLNPVFDGNQPTETAAGDKASYIENGVNFNPTLLFEGANDRLRTPSAFPSDDIRDVAGQKASVYIIGNSTTTSNGTFMDHGDDGAPNFIVASQRAAFGQSSDLNYTTSVSSQFKLISGVRAGSGTLDMYLDGLANGSQTDADSNNGNSIFSVGINTIATNDLLGNISEVIVYRDGHDATQQKMVQSYLAIKYGITLDQTVVPNYLASDGTTIIWNGVANATYKNDIAGIGRDDLSVLNQKQSKSVNSDAMVTIGVGAIAGTNAANSNVFTADKDFLIWGNDGGNISVQNTGLPTTGAIAKYRLGRTWKVAETGSVNSNNYTLAFENIPSKAYDIELYIKNNDDNFTTGIITIKSGTLVDGKAIFPGVDLNDNDVFTLGYSVVSPGGVYNKEVNGVRYKFYAAFTQTTIGDIATPMIGDLRSYGYIANFTDTDVVFNNEIANYYGLEMETDLQIDTAGDYTFRFLGLDDTAALWIDGVLIVSGTGVPSTTITSSAVTLTAGRHDMVVRFSENAGGATLNLQYSGPVGTWQSIPDSQLFTTAQLGLWLDASKEVIQTGDGTTATVWNDQSGNENHVTTTEGTPIYYNSTPAQLKNFNASIDFQDDAMTAGDNPSGIAFDRQSRTVFSIITPTDFDGDAGNNVIAQGDEVANENFGLAYWNGNQPRIVGWGDAQDLIATGATSNVDEPTLLTASYENSNINGVNNANLYKEGGLLLAGNRVYRTQLNAGNDLTIGDVSDGNQRFRGAISEVVYYPWNLEAFEIQKVESYLAIKYGITLSHNYYASDWDGSAGTTLWSLGNGYDNYIAGIGRDDFSALNQKISKSINPETILTMALDSDFVSSNSNVVRTTAHTNDKQFVIMGNNGDPLEIQFTELETSTNFNARVGREWKVNKTANFGQSVNLKFSGYDDEWYLISSATGNFSSGVSVVGSLDNSGAINATLTDGYVYTLASFVKSPGGVFEDLNLWLKADAGTTANLLEDSDLAFNDGSWTATGNVATSGGSFSFNSGNVGSTGVVTQSINTVLNESYQLKYRVGHNHSGAQTYRGPVSLRIDIIDNITSNILATETVTKMGYTPHTYHNLNFSASSTDTRIEITDTSTNGYNIDIWIDEFILSSKKDVNIGESVHIWEDQSIGGHDGYQFQAATSKLAVLSAANLNFNPSLTFDGTDDFYSLPTGILDNGNTNYSIITVQSQTATKEAQVLFLGNQGTRRGIYHQLDSGDRFESSWPSSGFYPGNPNPNEADIYTSTYDNGSGRVVRQDGLEVGTNTETNLNYLQTVTQNLIGVRRGDGASYMNGNINEIIVYNNQTTTGIELQRIESYLAIKYGITIDQTTPTNYLASGADVLWDATANATYSNDIAGIGRDDVSGLNQKQSKSVNDDAMVTMALGTIAATNAANVNTFTSNKDFLVWGNDDASTDLQTDDLPTGAIALQRLSREWKVQNTGAVANVTISFSNVAISPMSRDYELFIDTDGDGDFSTGGAVHGAVAVVSGNTVTFTGVTLANNTVFTLGMTTPAPGGIAVDLSLWLRADIGTNSTTTGTDVDDWLDQSTNQYTAAANGNTHRPTFSDVALNFNPAINFPLTGTHDIGFNLGGDYIYSPAEKEGMHIMSVVNPIKGGTLQFIYDFGYAAGANVGLVGSTSRQESYEQNVLGIDNSISTPSMIESDIDFGDTKTVFVNNKNMGSSSAGWSKITAAEIGEAITHTNTGGPVSIGRQAKEENISSSGGRRFFGDMGEVIVYTGNPEGTDALQIRSYLAIKYGITMDQTTPANYLASDATVLWDATATANATYSNNIAGIGQDDLSVLNQKQSKSVNADAIVTIGLGNIETTNAANTNAFAANKDFLIWGNNAASTSVINVGIPSVFSEKIARNWLVNEKGAVGATLIQIPDSVVTGQFTNTTELMLFVADDDEFTTNLVMIPLVLNGTNWEATVDFDGAKYFTFGVIPASDFMRHGKTFQGGEEQPMKF